MKTTLKGLALAAVVAAATVAWLWKSPSRPLVFKSPGGAQAAPVTDGFKVRGRVLHEGVAVPGARATLALLKPVQRDVLVTSPVTLRTEADLEGRFEFSGVPAGPARLAVLADRLAPSFTPLEIIAATDVSVALEAGLAIEGQVMAGGTPVAGARVSASLVGRDSLIDRRPWRVQATDSEGRFRIEGADPARPLRIAVIAEGFRPLEKTCRTPDAVPHRFDLDPGLASWGRVVTASGDPIVGAEVTAGQGEAYTAESRSGITGDVRIGGLVSRPLTIRVFKDGYAPAKLNLSGPSGGWTIVLRRNGGLEGRAPGEWLEIETGGATYRRALGADGTFRYEGLPAGPAEARATDRTGRVLATRRVEIPEGEIAGGILLAP